MQTDSPASEVHRLLEFEQPQIPSEHTSVAEHALPQLPQLSESFEVCTHDETPPSVLHDSVPLRHSQPPASQSDDAGQILPQLPQLPTSECSSTQAKPPSPSGHAAWPPPHSHLPAPPSEPVTQLTPTSQGGSQIGALPPELVPPLEPPLEVADVPPPLAPPVETVPLVVPPPVTTPDEVPSLDDTPFDVPLPLVAASPDAPLHPATTINAISGARPLTANLRWFPIVTDPLVSSIQLRLRGFLAVLADHALISGRGRGPLLLSSRSPESNRTRPRAQLQVAGDPLQLVAPAQQSVSVVQ
jgi:hypothetical protein